MDDLISRQAAIDLIDEYMDKCIELHYLPTGEGIKNLISVLPSAQPERWIPVTEGLPEKKKQVLVCDDFGEIYIAENETFSDGKWRWCESVEYRSLYGIVAWMPLPDPWRGTT